MAAVLCSPALAPRTVHDAVEVPIRWKRHSASEVPVSVHDKYGNSSLKKPKNELDVSMTPRKKREASGASEPVRVLGVGAGGVEELARRLDSTTVSWALLRFQVGGGTFARAKLVAVHCNGADTPVMLRGWLNARGPEALLLLGHVHANIEVSSAKELTIEYCCERLLPLFAADNMNYSLQGLRNEYGKTVAMMEQEGQAKQQEKESMTAKDMGGVTREEALRAAGADRGAYNWALLDAATLQLHNAGFGGLEEMKAWLAEDRVLFGVLRLSFGCSERHVGGCGGPGRVIPGITKHVLVHWVGPTVGAVRRGLWNAKLQQAAVIISSFSAVAFRREAHGLGDLHLEDIVIELRRLTGVDGTAAKDGVAAGRINVEEYLAALAAEARERREAAEDALRQKRLQRRRLSETPSVNPDELRAAIETVRTDSGKWNWVLCGWPRGPPLGSAPLLSVPEKGPGLGGGGGVPLALPPSPCRARRGAGTPLATPQETL